MGTKVAAAGIQRNHARRPDRLFGPAKPLGHLTTTGMNLIVSLEQSLITGGGAQNVICQVHMPFSLTRSRGEYRRVVGIREMVE